ncbi:hypothetical protein LZ189_15615, partial [Rhodovulum sulfidophilum]|nr:hypothetical protein [Rhodovulum sulfidophilum]
MLRDPVTRFLPCHHFMHAMRKLPREISIDAYLAFSQDRTRRSCAAPCFGLAGGPCARELPTSTGRFGPRLGIAFFEDLAA